jgi:hypothetical protein
VNAEARERIEKSDELRGPMSVVSAKTPAIPSATTRAKVTKAGVT